MAYLDEVIGVQAASFESETDPRKRASRALSLAQSILQVARQHHQQQDPLAAAQCYGRGIKLVEDALEARAKDETPAGKRAVRFGTFMLSELFSGIGVALNDIGRTDDALDAHKRALKIRKDTVAKGHPSLAECFNNLGAMYYATGNLQRAEEHYEQALELLVEASGGRDDGPHIALTYYNIGTCRAGQGHKQAAVASLRKALKVAERALGPDHEHVEMVRRTLQQWGAPAAS